MSHVKGRAGGHLDGCKNADGEVEMRSTLI
jgi:hypothetical protein